jgi:dTDP-4-amino-4,6-dideoxygalactose transaminase
MKPLQPDRIIYPLAADNWDQSEIAAMNEVIQSNRFTMGKKVKEFEQALGRKFNSKHVVMVNSGSSANLVMLAALRIVTQSRGILNPNIIVPAVSWSTTYTPAYFLGFNLKFIDVDPKTFSMDASQVIAAVDDATIGILAVNLLGSAADLEHLEIYARQREIFLLEDNCESLGATLNGRYTGTFGSMASHSSFFSHHINTMEGGWVTTNDSDLYEIMLSLRAHGWTRELPENSKLRILGKSDWFNSQFEFILPGLNFRPLEMEAAIGVVQIGKVDEMLRIRRRNAEIFKLEFDNLEGVTMQCPNGESSWFAFALLFESKAMRDFVAIKLRDTGIECRPIVTGNFTLQPVLDYLSHEIVGELPVANRIHDTGLYVGNHPVDLSVEIKQMSHVISQGLIDFSNESTVGT